MKSEIMVLVEMFARYGGAGVVLLTVPLAVGCFLEQWHRYKSARYLRDRDEAIRDARTTIMSTTWALALSALAIYWSF